MKSLLLVAILVAVSYSAPAKVCPIRHVTHGIPSTGAVTTKTPTTTTVEFCQKAQTVPFYRMYRLDVHDHFYTTNAAEVASAKAGGYAEEGVVGFILPAKAPNSVELYRL
ncbi:hypothetical protein AAVH_43583, partial [Aphelenchoides avenae]